MSIQQLHRWDVTAAEAAAIQRELSGRVSRRNTATEVALVAGVDISYKASRARAAVVVLEHATQAIVEVRTAQRALRFPYVPGLLSFREIPAALAAWEKLTMTPDLVLVDGQGIAHPRRFGLAAHLGLVLNLPTIGCAKTRLIGSHQEPAPEAGARTRLIDRGEVIGAVVRTRSGVKPLYVSIGHRVDLRSAIRHVLGCTRGFRLPEPQRLAHHAAGGKLAVQSRPWPR